MKKLNFKIKKRKVTILCGKLLLITLCFLSSLSMRGQISAPNFESAKNLETGQLEIALSFSPEYNLYSGDIEKFFHSYGVFTRIGVQKQIDIKLSYNRLLVGDYDDGLNIIQISPKFSSKSGVIALRVPFGIMFEKYEVSGGKEFETWFTLSPRIILTAVSKKSFKLSFIPMSETHFYKGGGNSTFVGLNIGMGFSSDFNIWSVRPELGTFFYVKDFSGSLWSFGLSASYIIDWRKKE
jgi:hypothetical protein